jgi:segregation and condensation protein B
MEPQRAKHILEAALLCSPETLRDLLMVLQEDWQNKGLELTEHKGLWRFQSREYVARYLQRIHPESPPKYSRATLETLAIIAYKQPVTRADIENIRGVAVSTQVLKTLEERDWVHVVGHKEAPGRPAFWATTTQFLSDLNLQTLASLPPLESSKQEDFAQHLQTLLPLDEQHPNPSETPATSS